MKFISYESILMPYLSRYFHTVTNNNIMGPRIYDVLATQASWNDECNGSWKSTELLL